MKTPFEKLVELVDQKMEENAGLTLGEVSDLLGEPVQRIMDAIDAGKMLRGETTYIEVR